MYLVGRATWIALAAFAVVTAVGVLPLTLLTNAVREPWLGLGSATGSLAAVAALAVATTVLAARRTAL